MLIHTVAASSRATTLAIASGPHEARHVTSASSYPQQPSRCAPGMLDRVNSRELEASPSHIGFHSYAPERQPLTMSRHAEDGRTLFRRSTSGELAFAGVSRHAEDIPTLRRSISGEISYRMSMDSARGGREDTTFAAPSGGCACAGCGVKGSCGSVAAAAPRRRRRSTKCDVRKQVASGLRIACSMSAGLVSEFLTGQTLWNALQSQDGVQHLVFITAFIFATGAAFSSESVDEVDACDVEYNLERGQARWARGVPPPVDSHPHTHVAADDEGDAATSRVSSAAQAGVPRPPVARACASQSSDLPRMHTRSAPPPLEEEQEGDEAVMGSHLPGRPSTRTLSPVLRARRVAEDALGTAADLVWPAVMSISKSLGEENLNGKLAVAGVFLVLLFQAIADNIPTLG